MQARGCRFDPDRLHVRGLKRKIKIFKIVLDNENGSVKIAFLATETGGDKKEALIGGFDQISSLKIS